MNDKPRIVVKSTDMDLLRRIFGQHADDMAAIIAKREAAGQQTWATPPDPFVPIVSETDQ
jgi:hypothetical protein